MCVCVYIYGKIQKCVIVCVVIEQYLFSDITLTQNNHKIFFPFLLEKIINDLGRNLKPKQFINPVELLYEVL